MVDSIKYKKQYSEIKQQSEFDIPQIRCKIHLNSLLECIYLNTNSDNILYCLKCVILNQLKPSELVFMEELFSKNSQDIINNWPPFQNKELYELLKRKEIQEDKMREQISQINSKFDLLRKDTMKIIDDHEKKLIAHLNMNENNRQNLFKIYNQMSEKEEIQRCIYNNQNNENQLQNYLKKIIFEKQEYCQQNEQKFQDSFDNLVKNQQKLSFDHLAKITEQILQYLKQVDFLNPFQQNINANKSSVNQEQLNSIPQIRQQQENQYQKQQQIQTKQYQNQIQSLPYEIQDKNQNYIVNQNSFANNDQLNQMQINYIPVIKKQQVEQQQEQQFYYQQNQINENQYQQYHKYIGNANSLKDNTQFNQMNQNYYVPEIKKEQVEYTQRQQPNQKYIQELIYLDVDSYKQLRQYTNYQKIKIDLRYYIYYSKLL